MSPDEIVAEFVDADFYRFANPDVAGDVVAHTHYSETGWKEGRDPNPWFSTNDYLAKMPALREQDAIPLVHFIELGAPSGIDVKPSLQAEAYFSRPAQRIVQAPRPHVPAEPITQAEAGNDSELIAQAEIVRDEFDADYYLSRRADVAASGENPLLHFLTKGWKDGTPPNGWFSAGAYVHANPELGARYENLFLHYLEKGEREGRALHLGFREEILNGQRSVEERIAAVPKRALWGSSAASLASAIAQASRSNKERLHISVSHDDFTTNLGGLQACLHREARGIERAGYDHLHLYPVRPLLFTNREEDDPITGVLVNGRFAGEFRTTTIEEVLASVAGAGKSFNKKTLAIHSLLGHNVPALTSILQSMGVRGGYFWVHDFASICAGHNLLRNDVEFCNAPPPNSGACSVCVFGKRRTHQVDDHRYLFERIPMTVVAPARKTLDTWSKATTLPAVDRIVHPHAVLQPRRAENAATAGPLRVALLGFPHPHKGWPVFRDLAIHLRKDLRYRFYHLGKGHVPDLPITYTEVSVDVNGRNDMVAAVEELGIDVAIIWSLCAETFCFTAYEAIAGGAAVVTTKNSGNLTKVVEETGKGITLADERALTEFFESGEALQFSRSKRSVEISDLQYSSLTADLITASTQ